MATLDWSFEDWEIENIHRIVEKYQDNPFVARRRERNVEPSTPAISRQRFWKAHLMALLTSQQRSGPESKVTKFLQNKIENLSLDQCREAKNLKEYVSSTLESHGGIRFYNNIGEACQRNIQLLEKEEIWGALESRLKELQDIRLRSPSSGDAEIERATCKFVYDEIDGEGLHRIGPKQSRNLLQALGLTRYETPLDSRISRWLNESMDLPYHISGSGLSEPEFYDFHMDLVQAACLEADVLPCMFDAAVFTSYSPEWPDDLPEDTFF